MQLPSVPRKLRGHHEKFVMAAQARPQWCHSFCIPRQLCSENNNSTRHHNGKNTRHRDAAVASHTAESWQ